MNNLRILSYKTLPVKFLDQIRKHKREAFESVMSPLTNELKILREDQMYSQKDIFGFLVAIHGVNPIGGLTLFKRRIKFGKINIRLGGIGGVWVKRDMQRKGVSAKLIEEGMYKLRDNDCDIAYLCTELEKLGGFFEKFGFKPLGRKYTFKGRSGRRYFEDNGMISPIKSFDLFEIVMKAKDPFDIGNGNW